MSVRRVGAKILLATLGLFLAAGPLVPGGGLTSRAFAQEEAGEAPGEEIEEDGKVQEKAALPSPVSGVSPETFRMIEMIEKKNRDLKKREAEIALKERRLQTLEGEIRQDLKKIDDAIARSREQIGIQKNLIKKNVDGLIKAYSAMKPQEAAILLEALNENLAIQILSGMKSKVAGKVFSKLDVQVAKNISEKLAGQKISPSPKTPQANQ